MLLVYRLVLLVYTSAWLIAHPVIRSSEYGPKWFILITNWAYIDLVVGFGAVTILCLVYTVTYYCARERILSSLPKSSTDNRLVYSQDNISWCVKIVWFLYISGATMAVMVTVGFWLIVYDGDEGDVDVASVHVHGINLVLVLVDLFLSRIPYQLLHFMYPSFIAAAYIAFTGVYFAAGGRGVDGDEHIYDALQYGDSPGSAAGLAVALVLAPMLFYGALFLLGWLRDVVFKRIPFLYRDIIRHDQPVCREPVDEPGFSNVLAPTTM